ncbi:hypothetical protein [Alteribacillus iranensis]|uniref:Uncharacterized protein n=1 Tax=Alteribacillus iranensis TaxID=930128 RepID=A0A1I1ZDU6_9BACI|nr:hypothetical protein [Alteribacillus iranensis]SFE29906.1 hypothetical protein SAMN05192532_101189 [Alteribacillus iranensis]
MISWRWLLFTVMFLMIWLTMRGNVVRYIMGNRMLRRAAITFALRIPYLRDNLLSSFRAAL